MLKSQRGIVQVYLILIVLAGISLALWYAYQTIDKRGYERGKSEVDAAYALRDNEALRAATAKIQQLQTAARDKEIAHALATNEISLKYQQDTDNARKNVASLNARVRSGDLRLFDPGAKCSAPSGGSGLSAPLAPAPGGDGGAAGQLSVAVADFLVSLAADADVVAQRLSACQSIVRADRK